MRIVCVFVELSVMYPGLCAVVGRLSVEDIVAVGGVCVCLAVILGGIARDSC